MPTKDPVGRLGFFFLFIALLCGADLSRATISLLEPGSHCVAYRTQKTILLVKRVTVIGKNCDITARVLPHLDGGLQIEVGIPIKSFRSGDETRDLDVQKLLRVESRADLTFLSKPLMAKEWKELLQRSSFQIEGELALGDKVYPLHLDSRFIAGPDGGETGGEVDGVTHMHFEDFGITPPRVALGMIVQAKSDLELHFHLQSKRIMGVESLRSVSHEFKKR